jgi:ribonucleotide reductase class II
MINRGLKLLSDFKFYQNYAKFDSENLRKETWEESVDRVMSMHEKKFKDVIENNPKFKEYFEFAREAYKDKFVLASQRSLQFGGEPIVKHNARMFNCLTSYCDRVKFFQECMYWLLCGCGVGFSVQKHHIEKLPKITKRTNGVKTFVVPDSIEGWSDSIAVLMSSYLESDMTFPEYQGCRVDFDFSLIRPEGSYISGGFSAPGPDGLRRSLIKIQDLLDKELDKENFDGKIKSIVAYDIVMHISDSVLSGGIRRSASICLFSHDDDEMLKAKTGDWYIKNPQRARSNNSVILIRDKTTREQFAEIMKSVKEFGEPGFVWSESTEILYNPCCITGDNWIMTSNGSKQVKDLVGKTFKAVVGGKKYETLSDGFWETGKKNVYKVITKKGYESKLTEDHRLKVGDIWKELKDFKIGDKINLSNQRGIKRWDGLGNFEEGWLLGSLVGDGTFVKKKNDNQNDIGYLDYWGDDAEYMSSIALKYVKNNVKHRSDMKSSLAVEDVNKYRFGSTGLSELATSYDIIYGNKVVTDKIEETSYEFYKGFLRGIFDADGSVQGNLVKGVSIRLSQSNLELLKRIQRMLSRIGIISTVYEKRREAGFRLLPDGNGGSQEYFCQDQHELVISKDNIKLYNDLIGFNEPQKHDKLNTIINSYKRNIYKENFEDSIKEIIFCGEEIVYDVAVETVNCFDVNGLIAHNCEIGMIPRTETFVSGWQGCNLTEINGTICTNEKNFLRACKASAIIGTMQASYTDFKYVGDECKEIFDREALLGCSITGWMNNPKVLFNPEIQKTGARLIKEINKEVAKILGINAAARTTCVKPSGNASVLLGTASGIHGEHSKRYFRNIQINKSENIGKIFKELNPKAVEESVWSANKTDYVFSFPIEAKEDSIFKDQLMGIKQLEYVKIVQQNWVEEGTNIELCVDPSTRHNVSNTILVDDWDEIEEYIYENRQWFAGISLLPKSGDKDYPQAPFTSVFTTKEIVEIYGDASLFASGLIVDGLHAFNNDLWLACNTVLGIGIDLSDKKMENALQRDWVRRAKQFADKHFTDIKQMTFCLKDVYNYHKWMEITRSFKKIDYNSIKIDQETLIDVDTMGSIGCAGGSCDLPT